MAVDVIAGIVALIRARLPLPSKWIEHFGIEVPTRTRTRTRTHTRTCTRRLLFLMGAFCWPCSALF